MSSVDPKAARGEPFIIAKAGKPLVKVTAPHAPAGARTKRLGFLVGQTTVPADFDRMGSAEIEQLFGSDMPWRAPPP